MLGSGDEQYRDYALESLATGFPVLLVDLPSVTWPDRYGCRRVTGDPTDSAAVLDAVRRSGVAVAGVVTYHEFCVRSAAEVAEALGLRGNSPETAVRCRDKRLMRRALATAGVPSARSIAVTTLGEASEASQRIGYPVVLKPASMAGSIGVVRVDEPAGLVAAFAAARPTKDRQFGAVGEITLVEEMLAGEEVSVESVVDDGRTTVVAVTRKMLGHEPYFEEVGHVVAPGEPLSAADDIARVTRDANEALGVRFGLTHTELRLGAAGPHVVEVAARAGGDLIPLLVRLVTGVDLSALSAAIATGRPWHAEIPSDTGPLAPADLPGAAAIRFFYPPHDLCVGTVSADPPAPRDLYLLRWEVSPGDELALPPRGFLSRVGFAVATGPTSTACLEQLDRVATSIRISDLAAVTS